MATTSIPVQTVPAYGGKVEDLTWTAAVPGGPPNNDDMAVQHPGGENVFLLVKNDDASLWSGTIVGVANNRTFDRTVSRTFAVSAGGQAVYILPLKRYNQGNGLIRITFAAGTTSVYVAAFKVAQTPPAT